MTACLLVAFIVSAPTNAQDGRLAEAQQLMSELEYEQASEVLLVVLDDPTLSVPQRVDAHLLAGVANRILKNDVEARLHFRSALELNPQVTLPADHAPKILTFFEMVKKEHAATRNKAEQTAAVQPQPDNVIAEPAPSPMVVVVEEDLSFAERVSYGGFAVAGLGVVGVMVNGIAVVALITVIAAFADSAAWVSIPASMAGIGALSGGAIATLMGLGGASVGIGAFLLAQTEE